MSRIGKKPVSVPSGVSVSLSGCVVKTKGPKGELCFDVPPEINVELEPGGSLLHVSRKGDSRQVRALHGMTRAMVANMVRGVSQGFEKRLHIHGTGYSCNLSGKQLLLNVGFMGRGGKNKPQFVIDIPTGLEIQVEVAASRGDNEPARMVIRGCDKHLVGQFAADIRRIQPPEPYKGKGIRYHDEVVRRKAGKALASGG